MNVHCVHVHVYIKDEPTMDEFESYKESILHGHDFLCQMVVSKNVADEIEKRGRHDLIRHTCRGFIETNERNDDNGISLMILKANMSRSDIRCRRRDV